MQQIAMINDVLMLVMRLLLVVLMAMATDDAIVDGRRHQLTN